jgi:hypothetical protein
MFSVALGCSPQLPVRNEIMAKTKSSKRRSAKSRSQREISGIMNKAATIIESRKDLAGERLTKLATATRKATKSFDDLPYLRDYTDAAVEKIGEMAEYVARTDIPEMLGDVAAFAKRQPVATFALSVAAGVVTTQLVRGWPTSQRDTNGNLSDRKSSRRGTTGAKRQRKS